MRQVYFLRSANGDGPIKIGCSASPEARRKQISIDTRVTMIILATAPGSYRDERNLHIKFAEHKVLPSWAGSRPYPIGGEQEWFDAVPELLSLIDTVHSTGKIRLKLEDRRELIFAKRYLNGETLQEIADDNGITRERVRQILRAAGIASLGYRDEHKRKVHDLTLAERRAAKMYADGVPPREILAATGLKYHHLRVAVLRVGGKTRAPGEWWKAQAAPVTAKVCELYRDGHSSKQIAEIMGMKGPTYVYRYLERGGVIVRKRNCRIENNAYEIISAYKSGKTQAELASQFGCSDQGITLLLRRHGVTLAPEERERRRIEAVRAANKRRFSERTAA